MVPKFAYHEQKISQVCAAYDKDAEINIAVTVFQSIDFRVFRAWGVGKVGCMRGWGVLEGGGG